MSENALIAVAVALVIGLVLFFTLNPGGVLARNLWSYELHKVDDATNYHTRKQVEDTCRALITSYTADRLRYEQYNGSDNAERQSWADQAKMRANSTAAQYNNYVLKNSFVFDGNVPDDISGQLEYID